ncbi:MAG: PD-(D/E)XK nuclease family protein [Actinomycetaceae bacterium]|nr:PD-(D/E)XK nuclease family protein [Actinomycetaceae bacterium]
MKERHAALSPSRAGDFKKCPLKFRFRTIDGLPEPPSLAALRGTIVHAVLEKLYDLPALDRIEQAAQELLEPLWAEHIMKDPSVADLFEGPQHRQEWLESARPLISSYFTLENPQNLQPVGRETFINATLPSGLAVRGIIDRIDEAPNGALRVVDYKTGKSPQPRFQDEAIFQMRFYAAALHYSRGRLPARTQLVYLGDGRILTYDPTTADVDVLTAEVDGIWTAILSRIDADHFEPVKGPLCNWCHFQNICPAFGGQAPRMSEAGVSQLLTAQRPTRSGE